MLTADPATASDPLLSNIKKKSDTMPENNPKFRAPAGELEKSILPQAGMTVTVADNPSQAAMASQVAEAAEYRQKVGNPLAPEVPTRTQPGVIQNIISAANKNNPTAGKNGNKTPGQSGLREDPWANSGMQGVNSLGTGYYNPGARGGMDITQKKNRL